MRSMIKYVCLLRGINVGGNKKVPMAELKQMFGALGYQNVKTLLNSGNVVFEAEKAGEELMVSRLEEAIHKTFGFESRVMVRSMADLEALIALDPFKEIEATKKTRLYVTFLRKKSQSALDLPYTSPGKDFRIIAKTNREVFSALMVETARSVDAMAFLEQEFGKDITTRNWNTVVRMAGS